MLAWAVQPARAANANVTIVTGGTFPGQCDAGSYAYDPVDVAIQPGDTVTFSNPAIANNSHPCQPADHPTRCAPETQIGKTKGECHFSNFALDVGESHTQPFPEEGTFQLQCLAHPYMLMTVVVGDGEPGSPDPDPTKTDEPDPDPTEPDEPDPAPTEPDEGQTATDEPTQSDAASPAPGPSPTADSTPAPHGPTGSPSTDQGTDPISQSGATVDDEESTARAPLLIAATALIGFTLAGIAWARGELA